jgi:hypothetical protein
MILEFFQYFWVRGIPVLTIMVVSVGVPLTVLAFLYDYLKKRKV